jgi:hypothetical protein
MKLFKIVFSNGKPIFGKDRRCMLEVGSPMLVVENLLIPILMHKSATQGTMIVVILSGTKK